LEMVNRELSAIPKDWAGEHGAFGGARVTRDDSRVDLKLDFRYAEVDRGAGEFAEQIKDPGSVFRKKTFPVFAWRLGLGPKPPSPAGSSSAGAGARGSEGADE